MASRVRVALLWHMHQPSYRDPVRGAAILPMVFLHAIKDYREMVKVAERHPSLRLTFNLVPSLLDQLPSESADPAGCLFLRAVLAPVAEVDEAERGNLLSVLFMADELRMILPLPRYYELYQKRARLAPRTAAGSIFSDQEFCDLTVLFLLAWSGTVIRREEPLVQELLRKGSLFTQKEKEDLVALLVGKASGIHALYREAQEAGRIEVSTSPYYHPILPLLFDLSSARASERDLPLPAVTASFAEDAVLQTTRALARYRALFGVPCRGVWPSEGALCPNTLDLLAREGVGWTASDEEVLGRSLGRDLGDPGARSELYRPWTWTAPGGGKTGVFFRDRTLSDLIGFTYQRWEPKAAVDHFLARIRDIRASLPREDGVIPVILDGENAWEHYPENGRPFLDLLYDGLVSEPGVETVTFSQALNECSAAPLPCLTPGSWIGGRLSTWVGHPEKNAGWELLGLAREALASRRPPEGGGAAGWEAAREEMLAAEGSDWFWWLGDDHWSSISDRFDDLFRLHLQNVFRLLGMSPPTRLFTPIKVMTRVGQLSSPVAMVTPVLDGLVTDYFEWAPSGSFDLLYEQGTMHRAGGILHLLRYGFDESTLYLRIDSDGPLRERLAGLQLVVEVVSPVPRTAAFALGPAGGFEPDPEAALAGVAGAVERIAELAFPLSWIGAAPGGEVLLALEVRSGAQSLERAPGFSLARLPVPLDYDLESWMV